jgi:hypothetical protein
MAFTSAVYGFGPAVRSVPSGVSAVVRIEGGPALPSGVVTQDGRVRAWRRDADPERPIIFSGPRHTQGMGKRGPVPIE